MSKVELPAVASPSPQYLAWLERERRGYRLVRAAQLAILVVFLASPDATEQRACRKPNKSSRKPARSCKDSVRYPG